MISNPINVGVKGLACIDSRVASQHCNKVTDLETLAQKTSNKFKERKVLTIATSGFGSVGYPKVFPQALGEAIKENGGKLIVLTGASAYGMDDKLADLGVVTRRYPYQYNPKMRKLINNGIVQFQDYHLGEWPAMVESGHLWRFTNKIDVAIVEASLVLEDGFVPTASVGAIATWTSIAKSIVIEVNTDASPSLYGFHDIYKPISGEPIPIKKVDDKVGLPYVRIPSKKIIGIIESKGIDHGSPPVEPTNIEKKIAENLINFLQDEIDSGRLPKTLYPLESGVGTVNDAVFKALKEAGFKGLQAWTEVVQDSLLELYYEGMLESMSCTSLMLTPKTLKELYDNPSEYKNSVILRPQEVTNNIEVIKRLRVIAINTAVEVDLLGNVNSTHILGQKIINGIGGSGDFSRGAHLSIYITPSIRKDGKITSIVPLVSHVDIPDHDVDVIITEQGVCDLRGLSPREKGLMIIENCAHPIYRDKLLEYYNRALSRGGHIPIDLDHALDFHRAYRDTGDMRSATMH